MMNFPDFFQSLSNESYEDIRLYEPDFSFLDSEDFKQKIEDHSCQEQLDELQLRKVFYEFFQQMNPQTNINVNIVFKGIGAAELKLSGESLNDLFALVIKNQMYKDKDHIENFDWYLNI